MLTHARKWVFNVTALVIAWFVVASDGAAVQPDCLHGPGESARERARRDAAAAFLRDVHAGQERRWQELGRYGKISDIADPGDIPTGFVPKTVVDESGYVVQLVDVFDACGFTLFSDDRGLIFEAHPVATEDVRRSSSS
jgi:hypothetical protein